MNYQLTPAQVAEKAMPAAPWRQPGGMERNDTAVQILIASAIKADRAMREQQLAEQPSYTREELYHGIGFAPGARFVEAVATSRPCLDADTTDADLAEWARTSIIPALEAAGLL